MITPEMLFLIKMAVTIAFVLFLSLLAEYLSPKVSGIISGIPTGTALILLFYGIEQGKDFAAQSSVYNLVGMVAMHVFFYLYYITSKNNKLSTIITSSLIATLGYLVMILLLQKIKVNLMIAILIPIISIILFSYIFRHIDDVKIEKRVKFTPKILLIRAIVTSFVILLVTGIAKIVGSQWAGLFSAFPTTVFPLILILHSTYGKDQVHTIIKNVPTGQWSVILYVIGVYFLYPLIGVYLGTLVSYVLVFVYLFLLFWKHKARQKL